MLRAMIVVASLALAAPAMAAPCAPMKMVRAVTQDATPGNEANAFARMPRTTWRLARLFARIDEPKHPSGKAHLLTVIREPDIWTVNRIDGTGRHFTDPGPVFEVRAPLLGGPGLPRLFTELEMGCELDFIADYAPTAQGQLIVGGKALVRHQMIIGNNRLEILLQPGGKVVHTVARYVDDKPVQVLRYLEYNADLPADMSLFEKPPGVTFTEAPAN